MEVGSPFDFGHGLLIFLIFVMTTPCQSDCPLVAKAVMPQSHDTPGPRTGFSWAVQGLFWTKIVRPLMGTTRAPCGAVRILPPHTGPGGVLMHALLAYGPRTGLWDHKQPMRGPYRPRTAKYDARAGFLEILVVSIPLGVRKGAVRHPCVSHTGPVGYEKHWRLPCGAPTMPVQASHGVPVESCELYNQTISMQPCLAVLSKVENPWSPNGPSTVDRWVVHVTFGWSVYDVFRNDNRAKIAVRGPQPDVTMRTALT